MGTFGRELVESAREAVRIAAGAAAPARIFRSDALAAVHEVMDGFHKSGAINDEAMREFDASCLSTPNQPNSGEG